jgi:hypothetical protein
MQRVTGLALNTPASRYRDAFAVREFGPLFTAYVLSRWSIQGLGFAAAGALAEVVSPHVAIVVAAACGFAAIACFAPRRAAAAPAG